MRERTKGTERRRVIGWVGAVLLAGGLLVGWAGPQPQPAKSGCQNSCYQAKSRAYQSCRRIPPSDREARERCFRQADAALEGCLRRCR